MVRSVHSAQVFATGLHSRRLISADLLQFLPRGGLASIPVIGLTLYLCLLCLAALLPVRPFCLALRLQFLRRRMLMPSVDAVHHVEMARLAALALHARGRQSAAPWRLSARSSASSSQRSPGLAALSCCGEYARQATGLTGRLQRGYIIPIPYNGRKGFGREPHGPSAERCLTRPVRGRGSDLEQHRPGGADTHGVGGAEAVCIRRMSRLAWIPIESHAVTPWLVFSPKTSRSFRFPSHGTRQSCSANPLRTRKGLLALRPYRTVMVSASMLMSAVA